MFEVIDLKISYLMADGHKIWQKLYFVCWSWKAWFSEQDSTCMFKVIKKIWHFKWSTTL